MRPVPAPAPVGAEGQCNSRGGEAAADPTATGAAVSGGIALQMTEGGVGRRAGPVEKIDIGSDERGGGAVGLTYLPGALPGVYGLVGGRLGAVGAGPWGRSSVPGVHRPRRRNRRRGRRRTPPARDRA